MGDEAAVPAVAAALEAAVRAVEWLDGRVQAFVHGEAEEIMKGVRPYLRTERGLARDQLSISGYWRRGRTEDGFREWKSEFAREHYDEPRADGRSPRSPLAPALR